MKIRISNLLMALSAFLLVVLSVTKVSAQEKKIVLATIDYPPYYAQSIENYGYVSEVIRESYKHEGYGVDIKFLPWTRGIEDAKVGNIDGVYALWLTEERKQWFIFCDPFPIKDSLSFVKLKTQKISPYKTFSDYKDYTIGTVQSYGYPENFKNAGLKFDVVVNDDTNIRKLIAGRLPLIVIDFQLAKYMLDKSYPQSVDTFETVGEPIVKYDQYLAISKKTPDFQKKVDAFNEGFKAITASGKVDAILKKYGFK